MRALRRLALPLAACTILTLTGCTAARDLALEIVPEELHTEVHTVSALLARVCQEGDTSLARDFVGGQMLGESYDRHISPALLSPQAQKLHSWVVHVRSRYDTGAVCTDRTVAKAIERSFHNRVGIANALELKKDLSGPDTQFLSEAASGYRASLEEWVDAELGERAES
ncbi:hypothetical protein [Nocardiopsis sp. CNT312]|uniref:hypothetical protein n=1 Tax=Nocardiopsis sp. CNT312 TaxID=1137268 RepID=UPI00048F1EF0|nr:hypothetical protein [Nocardiopsis sp. CNT312]